MKEIKLTQGKIALVDDEDFEEISQYRWQVQRWKHGFYATRRYLIGKGAAKCNKRVGMHQQIMKSYGTKILIDHKDFNGLNNQKSNLRKTDRKGNAGNQRIYQISKTSKYKGVTKRKKSFDAQIAINRKQQHLGCFQTEEQAALAYNEAAKRHFGEFALLNTI